MIKRMLDLFDGYREAVKIRRELCAFSERELHDIGLTRSDIDRVAWEAMSKKPKPGKPRPGC